MLKKFLLLVIFILSACQPTPVQTVTPTADVSVAGTTVMTPTPIPTPNKTPHSAVTVSPPPRGGTAILGLGGQPDNLNPLTGSDPALRELTPLLFDTLLGVDPHTAELQPGLAERWEYSDDGQQVTFHLPSSLKWSNGTPLTAEAIADSLKATEHPALQAFSQVTAPDPRTLRLTFAKIDCAAMTTLAQLPLIPAAVITQAVPMGSGPFQVADWSANKRTLTLTRNPNFRGQAPLLDGLTIRFIANDKIDLALSEGQFDLVGPISNLPSLISTPSPPLFTDLTYPAPQMIHLAINYAPRNVEPIDSAVRQALRLALDRETILAEALGGDGQLTAGPLLSGHWAANMGKTWPNYDPEAARKLLAQAGWRDTDGDGWLDKAGKRLELSIRVNGENPLSQNLGWLVSSYYRDLGLFARAEGVPFDNLLDDLFTHDFSLAIFSWPLLPDPDQRLFWRSTENTEGSGLNFISYKNPKLDDLLDRAVAVPGCAASTRAKIYAETQQILAQDRPVDFLLVPNRHLLVGKRLQGVTPSPFVSFLWNVTEWYLTE